MGDHICRPEVAEKSMWGEDYLDQAELGVDIYLGLLGVTFALSFTCLFVSAGVYASLNQTPENCTEDFFKIIGIFKMQVIHTPQTFSFVFFAYVGPSLTPNPVLPAVCAPCGPRGPIPNGNFSWSIAMCV